VTGRILEELRSVFPAVDAWFDALVVENGAVLSVGGATRVLAAPVEFELDEALVERDVPFRRGQVLLATQAAHEGSVRDEIRRLGLECQLTRNRGELMVLPPGISKGSGLFEALGDLGLSHHSALAVGDGENDHSLLRSCELGAAVANAVEGLRRHADLVLEKPGGAGVAELLRGPIVRGEEVVEPRRWRIELGRTRGGERVTLPGSGVNLLVTGRSQSGKSFVAGMLCEQLIGLGYSLCIIDPEGDYAPLGGLRGVLDLGGRDGLPEVERIGPLIQHRFGSVVLDLSLSTPAERGPYVQRVMARLETERRSTGLPHWIVCDEAHDPFGPESALASAASSRKGFCLVTCRPHVLAEAACASFDFVLALPGGEAPAPGEGPDPLVEIERRYGVDLAACQARPGEALLVAVGPPASVVVFARSERRSPHVRHWNKYAQGRLPPALRFAFRNESGALRAVSANVAELHQAVRVCDAGVLRHHAGRLDLSRWLRDAVRDAALARDVRAFEQEFGRSPRAAADVERLRQAIVRAIERRYGD
jgi:haloacid dehalogenase-like hydrolase/Helicase HerA, central domain